MSFLMKGVSSIRSFQYFGLMLSSSTAWSVSQKRFLLVKHHAVDAFWQHLHQRLTDTGYIMTLRIEPWTSR